MAACLLVWYPATLLSHIVVRITQQQAVYQECVSVGMCSLSHYLAVGQYITLSRISPVFMISILQIGIRDVKVFPVCQFYIVNKS
jgi:hypothetical protein